MARHQPAGVRHPPHGIPAFRGSVIDLADEGAPWAGSANL